MTDENIIKSLINDLLKSGEYSLPGIASYTDTPEDVVYDIASGLNTRPSLFLARKIIDLHKEARKEVYAKILNKILESPTQPYHHTISINNHKNDKLAASIRRDEP